MGNKRFNFWIDECDLQMLKEKAGKENRSLSNFIKTKLLKVSKEKKNE